MRSCPPLKGLQSINPTFCSMEGSPINDCRLMQQLRNENIGFYEKHLWFQNFNLSGAKVYSSKLINETKEESERVKEIQRKIRILRESNDLLITYIRQLYDLTQSPTKADLEYLHHLFRLDEEHLVELSESLRKGKLAIDRKSGKQEEEHPNRVCEGNCNCNVCGCGDAGEQQKENKWIDKEYVIIDAPPPAVTKIPSNLCKLRHDKLTQITSKEDYDPATKFLRCPFVDLRKVGNFRCESRDIFKMEDELQKIEERIQDFGNIRIPPSTDSKKWNRLDRELLEQVIDRNKKPMKSVPSNNLKHKKGCIIV